MGFEVIFHTLSELFPLTDIPTTMTTPLSGEQFLRLILVPEASLSLIMEDLGQTRPQALLTRSASVLYGEGMFPEGDNDVVDGILIRRIRAQKQERDALEVAIGQDRKRRVLRKRPRPPPGTSEFPGRESLTGVKKVKG